MSNIAQLTTAVAYTHNGAPATNSLVIAERFGKRHHHVLRAIKRLECSPEFSETNFGLAEYIDEQGKPRPYYIITRDGFMFLAMGFTGKEAAQWKERFITAFNELEKLQYQPQLPLAPTLDGTRWLMQFSCGRAHMRQIPDGALMQTREELLTNIKRTGGLDAMFSIEYIKKLVDACFQRMDNEVREWKGHTSKAYDQLKRTNQKARQLVAR